MTIFERVRALDLLSDEYAVVGGGVLEAHGLRRAGDIDLLVSAGLFEQLESRGWKGETGLDGVGTKLRLGEAEAFTDIGVGSYQPDSRELLARAETIQDIRFFALADLSDFKRALGRAKDLHDLALIDAHLHTH